jgi:uncharacterized protein YkwD
MVRVLRQLALAAVAALLLAIPASASADGPWDSLLAPESACPGQSDVSAPADAQEATMLCMHNYARAAAGLGPFHAIGKLRVSAGRKAKDLKGCDDFSHEACGRSTFYWVRKVGFARGTYGVGENLAWGTGEFGSVGAIMSNWLNSDEHRDILLTPKYDDLGIGMVQGRFQGQGGAQVWVTHFGFRN